MTFDIDTGKEVSCVLPEEPGDEHTYCWTDNSKLIFGKGNMTTTIKTDNLNDFARLTRGINNCIDENKNVDVIFGGSEYEMHLRPDDNENIEVSFISDRINVSFTFSSKNLLRFAEWLLTES